MKYFFIFLHCIVNLLFIYAVPEYEFYTQKKYEKEMECAIQMSLGLEDEKKRLFALEEEELRVSQIN